ncbi:MAG: hypothetical protein J5892_04200 [Bacilli bacterium]|nr:hypothetical protein [Bacilli bacterium]
MKTLYDIQDKEGKKKVKQELKNNKKNLYNRLIRIRIVGLILLVLDLCLIGLSIYEKVTNYYNYIAYFMFLVAALFFLYESWALIKKECNKILKKKQK